MEIELVDYKGRKLHGELAKFKDELFKQIPNIEFDYIRREWGEGSFHIDGIKAFRKLNVFDIEDLKTPIAQIGLDGEQYWVASPNVKSGRGHWGDIEGQQKRSKHMKNMIKSAKESIKPLTFEQAMSKSFEQFRQDVRGIQWEWERKIDHQTGRGALGLVKEDMLALAKMGYEPKNIEFKRVMDYINNNLEVIDKYYEYEPKAIGVWIRNNKVEYQYTHNDKTIHSVPDKMSLPQDILGKICLMDIDCVINKLDQTLGMKYSDNQYWVMCE